MILGLEGELPFITASIFARSTFQKSLKRNWDHRHFHFTLQQRKNDSQLRFLFSSTEKEKQNKYAMLKYLVLNVVNSTKKKYKHGWVHCRSFYKLPFVGTVIDQISEARPYTTYSTSFQLPSPIFLFFFFSLGVFPSFITLERNSLYCPKRKAVTPALG